MKISIETKKFHPSGFDKTVVDAGPQNNWKFARIQYCDKRDTFNEFPILSSSGPCTVAVAEPFTFAVTEPPAATVSKPSVTSSFRTVVVSVDSDSETDSKTE